MNSVIKTALNRLIQDDTFRTELEGLLDEVNRAAKDPGMVSRAEGDPPVPEEESAAFADIKDALLADPAFLKALMDQLMAINTADAERATQLTGLKEEVQRLSTNVLELNTTLTEHDSVLTELAEKVIIRESEQPRTVRARNIVKDTTPAEKKEPDLGDRAARVLTRMGAKANAS